MDDLLVRIRAQVENATAPIEPDELATRPHRDRSRLLNLAAVGLVIAVVVGIVALRSTPEEQRSERTPSASSVPEDLGRSVQRIDVDGVGSATEVDITFDGELPPEEAVHVGDITSVRDPSFSFTTQSVDGVVWVCEAQHFGFGPTATGGSIDVLIPSHWLDPSGVQVPEGAVEYSDAIDHVGKIVGCGPYKGYVQYSIWGAASIDPDDISVFVDDDSIHVVVEPPEG